MRRTPLYPGRLEVWMDVKDHRILRGQMVVAGATNRSLAADVDCAHGMIGDLARGAKKSCSPELAHRIAAALGTTVDTLFFVESSREPRRNAQAREKERRHMTTRSTGSPRRARSAA